MNAVDTNTTTQYLTFHLREEVFALDISTVREVMDFTSITKMPCMPDYMRGVINLRGSVVPVIDLRQKMGMPSDYAGNSCIIITEVSAGDGTLVIGALADAVQEVMDLEQDHIEPPPKIGNGQRAEFIKGMGKQGDRFIMILDIEKLCASDSVSSACNDGFAAVPDLVQAAA
jgi:purine-binding chemotaxis protein CheW